MAATISAEIEAAGYGAIDVVRDLTFSIPESGRLVLLGANGAGKTTTLRAISAMCSVRGSIRFGDSEINGLSTHRIAALGLAHVPQGRGTVGELTVRENLQVGGITQPRRQVSQDLDYWMQRFPRLEERHNRLASGLSGGEQQMLAIARAFMSRPRLLLLDEPSLGLAPLVTAELFSALDEISKERGTTLLIVEQNAELALSIADEAIILESGRPTTRGPAADLRGDDDVRRAYLGV